MIETRYSKNSEKNFLLIVGFIFVLLTFYLIKDIFILLIYSIILSYFLYPIYNYFLIKLKNKKISSILTIVTVTLVLFIPIILLTYFLILNLIKLVLQYKIYIQNPDVLNSEISTFISKFTNSQVLNSVDYSEYLNTIVQFVIDLSKNFFNSIPIILFDIAIIIFITYYILINNRKVLTALNNYLPLSLKKQNEILKNLTKNIKVLFKGYFLTGFIQTLVAGFGYLIFGVPNLLIVISITLFASLLPYIGTPIVWVPVSLYMIITGQEFGGLGLLIYGTLIISTIDNFLRPILMSAKDTIPPPLVFIGFVGGMLAFGISGIILGPLIISITSILLRYIKEHYQLKGE